MYNFIFYLTHGICRFSFIQILADCEFSIEYYKRNFVVMLIYVPINCTNARIPLFSAIGIKENTVNAYIKVY